MGGSVGAASKFVFTGFIASTANIIAMVLIAVFVFHRQSKRQTTISHPANTSIIIAATIMSTGSAVYAFCQNQSCVFNVIEYAGLAFASGGYVWLTALWGRYYASLDAQEVETYAIWSTFLCAALYLLALITISYVSIVIWLCLPICTAVCLIFCEKNSVQTSTCASTVNSLRKSISGSDATLLSYKRVGLAVLVASFSISLPTGLFELTALHGSAQSLLGFTTVSGLVLAVILVIYCTIFARRINLSTFYRWLSPLTIIGLFLISLPSIWLTFSGFGLIFAAQWVLYLFIWIYLSELCRHVKINPILIFMVGRLIFEFGFLAAYVVGGFLPGFLAKNGVPLVFIAFGIAVILVISTVFSGGNEDSVAVSNNQKILVEEKIAQMFSEQSSRIARRYSLSPRESEILQYLVRGYSLPYIRNELYISRSTIDSHVRHIYKKCDIHSREELITLFGQGVEQCNDNGHS